MSFLVIIASLIAFMILIIIEKMLIFIERIRNQKAKSLIGVSPKIKYCDGMYQ